MPRPAGLAPHPQDPLTVRVCLEPGCPTLVDHGRCTTHQRQRWADQDTNRPTTTERGYGAQHQHLRDRWAAVLAARPWPCSRCGELITTGQAWHLDHDDDDRTTYRGPAHTLCNLKAAGQAAHRKDPTP